MFNRSHIDQERENVLIVASIDQIQKCISEVIDQKIGGLEGTGRPDPYLNVEQAATYMSCSARRIHDLSYEQKLRFKRDGKRLLTRVSWIESYLDDEGNS